MLGAQVALLFLCCTRAAGLPEHCTKVVGKSGGSSSGGSSSGGSSKGGSSSGGSSSGGTAGGSSGGSGDNSCCSASYCAACCGKNVNDACSMTLSEGVCCTVDNAGTKTCQDCQKNVTFEDKCKLHSRNGNMGCFSPPEFTEPTYHACEGRARGDKCIAGSIVGECILHYDHGKLMCLEAVGSSGECEGLGVGQSCPVGCLEDNHLCSHHSRRGNMMCIVPTGATDSAIVCKNKDRGDFCGYIQEANPHNAKQGGYFEGVCHPHDADKDDTHMLCTLPENLPGNDVLTDLASGSWGSCSAAAVLPACALLLLH